MCKLLVVDDEKSYCEVLRRHFSSQGFSVRTATGCEQAMAIAAEFIPDVLIVDWMLSTQTDGADVAQQFRVMNPRIGVVFVSGYPNVALQAAADADESCLWLSKPFHLNDVTQAVNTVSPVPS